jgi:hypothetical protein
MRRSASETIRNLEMRLARLENRSASTTKVKNPVFVEISYDEDFSSDVSLQVFCPKSELKNIEGFCRMNMGTAITQRGSIGTGSNPMVATQVIFDKGADLKSCLADLSKTYTLIESKA